LLRVDAQEQVLLAEQRGADLAEKNTAMEVRCVHCSLLAVPQYSDRWRILSSISSL
jgi:hypothetical protein